jgi:hypothetical protein
LLENVEKGNIEKVNVQKNYQKGKYRKVKCGKTGHPNMKWCERKISNMIINFF